MNYENYYLFSRPSFIEGMARILDIGSTLDNYNFGYTSSEADIKGIYSDWKVIRDDLGKVMKNKNKKK